MTDHRRAAAAPTGSVDHTADAQADLAAALDDAYRALRDACDHARRVLMDSQPGRLPLRCECEPQFHWLLEAIEIAERNVDRLRLRTQPMAPAAAAHRAAAAALPWVLDHVARQEREATRLLGRWAVSPRAC